MHQDPAVSLGYGLVSSGAALLPDIDTETSTVTAAVPFGRVLLAPVRAACRGHRQASHSLLGAGVLFVVLLALSRAASPHVSAVAQWPARALFPALMAWLGLRATLTIARRPGPHGPDGPSTRPLLSRHLREVVGLAGAVFAAWIFTNRTGSLAASTQMMVALGVGGYLTHLAGDAIFNGIPLLWPHRARWRITRLVTGTPSARVLDLALAVVSLLASLLLIVGGR